MKIGKILLILAIMFTFLFRHNVAFAKSIEEEIAELKTRVAELEKKLIAQQTVVKEQKEEIEEIKETGALSQFDGIKIGSGATFVIQGTNDANATGSKGEDITDASYSISLTVEKEFDDFGMAFIEVETGDGAGVEDELTLFSNVNADADDSGNSLSVTKAWYEHYLFDRQFTVTFGKIDAGGYLDQNEVACDECIQFLGRMFKHNSTIEFPENTAGLHGLFTPAEAPWLEIEAQVLDGDDDWEDIGDEVFAAGQINFKPKLIPDRDCNYRFYGWYNDTNHIEWNDTSNMKEENYGFGVSADQEITDIVTLFGRYGWQNPEVYASGADFSLEHSWSAGCQIVGVPWDRDEDHLGLAIGMEIPSEDYKDSQNRNAKDEGHFEAYYSCRLNEHLTVSPDFQMIWNAYGDDVSGRDDTIFFNTIYVFGTRGQVDF
jgi:high affinity Mn2+ porin